MNMEMVQDLLIGVVIFLALIGTGCALSACLYLNEEDRLCHAWLRQGERENAPAEQLYQHSAWLFNPEQPPTGWRQRLFQLLHNRACTVSYILLLRSGQFNTTYLHQVMRRYADNSLAATLLRLLSQVLLIIGIFGTLLSVHTALGTGNGVLQLSALAPVLLPGFVAIVSTILLVSLRHVYLKQLLSYMHHLDTLGSKRRTEERLKNQVLLEALGNKVEQMSRVLTALSLSEADTALFTSINRELTESRKQPLTPRP